MLRIAVCAKEETMPEVLKFTVLRERWIRSSTSSFLRRFDGHMCCLGFLAMEVGYTEEQITNLACPNELTGLTHKAFPVSLMENGNNTDLCQEIMCVNDSAYWYAEEREDKLTELFAKAGIEVSFV